MKKSVKYLISGMMIVILACTLFCPVFANGWETYDYSAFNKDTYVYDIGSNFKDKNLAEKYNKILKEMKDKYGITYAFIIVNDYNDSTEELADYIWEHAGYNEDYISVVVSVQNGMFSVDTYGEGILIMTNDNVDKMYDAVKAKLVNHDWDGSLKTFADSAKNISASYYSLFDIGQVILWAVIVGIIVTIIALAIEISKHKPVKKATNADLYVKDENVNMSLIQDSFLRSHEVRTRVNNSSSGGGGGRSGGSTHIGSSGRSRGGRSGRF